MSDLNLKPCPFCGGKAVLSEAEECGQQAYVVSCNQCLASSQVRYALMEPVDQFLTEAWNMRVQIAGDVQALTHRKPGTAIPKRIGRRIAGYLAGRGIGSIFKPTK